MEVFLVPLRISHRKPCLLHARGGVSGRIQLFPFGRLSSPRSWRCFPSVPHFNNPGLVFSTLVEVFLNCLFCPIKGSGLLHARGGVSGSAASNPFLQMSSPRSWRCFSGYTNQYSNWVVFSTLVEVFLGHNAAGIMPESLLHARGGVSNQHIGTIPDPG